jgi:ferredoxin
VTPFDVLDVSPDADEAAIRRAYRRRVKEAHPDQGGSIDEFRAVRDAYDAIESGEWDGAAARNGAGADGGDGDDPRWAEWADGGADDGDGDDDPATATVEYLNYGVLDDRGWSLDDEDLFDRAAAADLSVEDYGRMVVERDQPLLKSAEENGQAWPFACRGGACANCAVAIVSGETATQVDNVLPGEMVDRGIRLSCICTPVSGDVRLVYNVKRLPGLDDLKLPADRFEQARADD